MHKSFTDYMKINIQSDGFQLGPRDAYDTGVNITHLFKKRTGWFSSPKPVHISELCKDYKDLCPGMETSFPGHIDKIFTPKILTLLGFPVDEDGLVYFK